MIAQGGRVRSSPRTRRTPAEVAVDRFLAGESVADICAERRFESTLGRWIGATRVVRRARPLERATVEQWIRDHMKRGRRA